MSDQLTSDHPEDERLELNPSIFPNPTYTLLVRVPDDSVKGTKIRQGDMLIVDRSIAPRDGQLVVVLINGKQIIRRATVHDSQIFVEPPGRAGESMRIGARGVELVGVAKAFIPVIMEQNSSPSDLEVFMKDSNSPSPLRFAILSVLNSYSRTIVGADGEIFTLGWKAVQELAGQHLVDQPVAAGTYRINDDQTLDIRTNLRIPPPYAIAVWSEALLGVLAVCAYLEAERTWYFWVPER